MRCAPAQVDFCTLVWLWSSKNVASQNQRESAMISRYKYRNFALKSQITTHHFHRSSNAQNHRYHNRQLTHPPNLPGCHYRVCGIDLCRRRYDPNPHRSETMGIGAIWPLVFFLRARHNQSKLCSAYLAKSQTAVSIGFIVFSESVSGQAHWPYNHYCKVTDLKVYPINDLLLW